MNDEVSECYCILSAFYRETQGILACYLARESPDISILSVETAEVGKPHMLPLTSKRRNKPNCEKRDTIAKIMLYQQKLIKLKLQLFLFGNWKYAGLV